MRNMAPPQVSVLMAAFNEEQSIGRAIDSVLRQSYESFELVIINDGSHDATEMEVARFNDERIIYKALPQNQGKAFALNLGLTFARGNFIAFLDADDAWRPSKLERQVECLQEVPSPLEASVVGQHITLLDDGISTDFIPTKPNDWVKELLQVCSLGAGSTLMVRKEVFDLVGVFDEELTRCIDHDWVLRFAEQGGSFFIDQEILADIYTLRGKQSVAATKAVTRFSKKHRHLYRNYEPQVFRRAQWELWKHIADRARREGNKLGLLRARIYTALSDPRRAVLYLVGKRG
jgi:glycosyltransferase involved in cell wall biosynthesis